MDKKIKLFAASVILAGNIVLLPGCHEVMASNEADILSSKNDSLDELNSLDDTTSDYRDLKRIEKIYSKIDENSVKVERVLAEVDDNSCTFYTSGCDVMVIISGKENVAWFSSNVTPSDAYSAIASYNISQSLSSYERFDYLNPSHIRYMSGDTMDNISISYSDGGKLEISGGDDAEKIVVCMITPSAVKNLNDVETEKYILEQPTRYDIPNYALMTLRNSEETPVVSMVGNDTIGVLYDGRYFETYIGFAEKDFGSIPFFGFEFNEFNNNNHTVIKA